MDPQLWIPLATSVGGTLSVTAARWFLGQGARKKKATLDQSKQQLAEIQQQQAIETANERLARELRDELRGDLDGVRERLSKTEGRVDELSTDNANLRKENMELKGQNGSQAKEIETLHKQVGQLETSNAVMMRRIDALQADRLSLIDAIRKANIPLPPLIADRPAT